MKTSIPLQNSRGVALLAALFVLMVMSILSIGMLANVDEDIKISKNVERSERALKVAEAGLQIARSTFFDPAEKALSAGETRELNSVNGYIHGGYFLAQLTSGFSGQEKWTQWRYDIGLSGNNQESEITAPLRRVWATSNNGTNGTWSSGGTFSVENLYGIVATGVYFPIAGSNDTRVRAHHEYTGRQEIWSSDQSIVGTNTGSINTAYATNMGPMTTYTDYGSDDIRDAQVIYYTYSGSNSSISGADTTSTVRLRASDAMNDMAAIWEFDTNLHGIGTAPAMFELDNNTRLIYFSVISMGAHSNYSPLPPGQTQSFDLNNATSGVTRNISSYPSDAQDHPEQLYLFAIVDRGRSYTVKWNRPFPDPDVVEWTDYPTEHATGTNGQSAPFIGRPSDIRTYLPEDDLLVDYRDGPGADKNSGYGADDQWNQMRGNVFAEQSVVPSFSPPIVNVLYTDAAGNLTENRSAAANPLDPIIDIYMMYANFSRVTYYRGRSDRDTRHNIGNSIRDVDGDAGWGTGGYLKPNAVQTRVMSLRDYLVHDGTTWDWQSPKSRFPEFKWTYRVPGHDPDATDQIPADGYGEYSWDAWFSGQTAPMIMNHEKNSEDSNSDGRRGDSADFGASFAGFTAAGSQNLYTVLYPYFKSTGFPTGTGADNTADSAVAGPGIFSNQGWLDARIMMYALRDTWNDYKNGNRTNILGLGSSNLANPELSNPVEPYWYYSDDDQTNGPNTLDHQYQDGSPTVNYIAAGGTNDDAGRPLAAPFPAGVREGFPRPYTWSESVWNANISDKSANLPTGADPPEWSLYSQGWEKADFDPASPDTSEDADIESETAAMCKSCLRDDGLIVLTFNHDLDSPGSETGNREDLRLHGINSRTGLHAWDYHIATSRSGDNANNTPAIANNKVFVAHMMFGAENTSSPENRVAMITVLDATDGEPIDKDRIIDKDADAVILSPSIANGMAYVATYNFNGVRGSNSETRNEIRLFAMSPMVRLVSTGIYPASPDLNIDTVNETVGTFKYHEIFKDADKDYAGKRIQTARRRIQVWISGDTSRWEEIKEEIVP